MTVLGRHRAVGAVMLRCGRAICRVMALLVSAPTEPVGILS
jgi:hypothetical protein